MFKVRVFTPAYLLSGEVEETNAFLGWLNNDNKSTLDLHNVEGLVLDPSSSMPATTGKLVTIAKSQVVAIDMFSSQAQKAINLSGRKELAVLYTPRFIIQANMYPRGDMTINKIPDVTKSKFVAIGQAKLHPLLPTRKMPTLESPLMVLNWHHLDFYHAR